MKIAVFNIKKFELDQLQEANAGKHELKLIENYLSAETATFAESCECVLLFANDDASAKVLEKLKSVGVKYIALRSAGFNHVDLKKAKELRLKVANVPEYSPNAVAEHAIALMMALNRKLIKANSRVKELNFSIEGLTGFDMKGKTVGIIGTGRIGSVVAKILYGFGCELLGFDIKRNQSLVNEYGLKYVNLNYLCEKSDIISLHLPLNEQTQYIIAQDEIKKMKNGVMLINTGRGALVDTKAIIKALKSGKIGFLGIDVYEKEKGLFFEDHSEDILQDDLMARLLTFQNVLITSHQAFLTQNALKNIAETTFNNINCWAKGLKSENEII